jgi:folate-binding protein YgfZ
MTTKIAILPGRAVIRISGEETLGFLQDLVTANIAGLAPGQSAHAGLLTPQGKILFDFHILATGNGVLIDCAASQADQLLQRLMMYRLRRKLEMSRAEELGVAAAWDGPPPALPEDCVAAPDSRSGQLGSRLVGLKQALEALSDHTAEDYARHRHELGIADADEAGSGELFPHEANYDQFGSVDFSKGCYVGQEVVSRMQHRGTARSRVVPVTTGEPALPQPGTDVMAGGRRIGSIIAAAGASGLAVVRLDRAGQATEAGESLTAGDVAVTLHKPQWAAWELAPGPEAE